MREVWIELNELLFGDFALPCGLFQPTSEIKLTLRVAEEFFENWNGLRCFGQNSLGGHFTDICGRHVDTVNETVLHLRKLHTFRIQSSNDFIELFLRGNNQPYRSIRLFRLDHV